ncbi:hypothetical protein D3C76_1214790 [compost metagenome]
MLLTLATVSTCRRSPGCDCCSSTNVPMPCRVSTNPEACSLEIASRTTVRLTPCSRTMVDSEGSFSPGFNCPSKIRWVSASTTPWARLADRLRTGVPLSICIDLSPQNFALESLTPTRDSLANCARTSLGQHGPSLYDNTPNQSKTE